MNIEIRNKIKASGLKQWQVAKKLNVAESTFIRWLRDELSEEQKNRIYEAIEELQEARAAG